MKIQNNIKLVILQHPKESRSPLSTTKTVVDTLSNVTHKIGLSWRSFTQIAGAGANPKEWAVLYLGTKKGSSEWAEMPFAITDPKDLLVKKSSIKGLLLLDGSWKESKTMWWRNPWLLKLNRIVLNQTPTAKYDSIRKEPRVNCLSTIEAATFMLAALGDAGAATGLSNAFSAFMRTKKESKDIDLSK